MEWHLTADCCFSKLALSKLSRCVGFLHCGHYHHFIKCNLFSPWYSWKIAHLALNSNHSLSDCHLIFIYLSYNFVIYLHNFWKFERFIYTFHLVLFKINFCNLILLYIYKYDSLLKVPSQLSISTLSAMLTFFFLQRYYSILLKVTQTIRIWRMLSLKLKNFVVK